MSVENQFRLMAAVALVAAMSISIYHRWQAEKSAGEKVSARYEGKAMFLALRLGGLLLWGSVFAYLINPAWMAWSRAGLSASVRWPAVAAALVCDALLFWMFRSLGGSIPPTVATRAKHQLVRRGPYRYVRHPLYTIATAFFVALALVADNWFLAASAILAFALLAMRVPNEEAHLIQKFGDEYRSYMRSTGAFLPRLRNQAKLSAGRRL